MSAQPSAGYSGTPLPRKLGLKDGQRAAFIALPDNLNWLAEAVPFLECLLADVPPGSGSNWSDLDIVHAFVTEASVLGGALPTLHKAIAPAGMIWVSWPKRVSKRLTDITEDVIRRLALPLGLVDVKVCAVDEVWSGLKLVIRKALRPESRA